MSEIEVAHSVCAINLKEPVQISLVILSEFKRVS